MNTQLSSDDAETSVLQGVLTDPISTTCASIRRVTSPLHDELKQAESFTDKSSSLSLDVNENEKDPDLNEENMERGILCDSRTPERSNRRKRIEKESIDITLSPEMQKKLSSGDMGVCERKLHERMEREYEMALMNRHVGYLARYHSLRSSASLTSVFFMVYILIGYFFYSWWEASWTAGESLLFVIYTITTVGYGNYSVPDSPLSRIFTTLYLLVGIALITVVFSEVYGYLALEATRAQYSVDKAEIARRGLNIIESSQMSEDEDAAEAWNFLSGRKLSWQKRIVDKAVSLYNKVNDYLKYNQMGQILSVALPFIFLLGVGAAVVGSIEGWSVIDSIYFAVVSLSTVGYGDLYPTKPASVWFCVFYLPFSLYFMSLFLSQVASVYIKIHTVNIRRLEHNLMKKGMKKIGVEENDDDNEKDDDNASPERRLSMREYLEKIKTDELGASMQTPNTATTAEQDSFGESGSTENENSGETPKRRLSRGLTRRMSTVISNSSNANNVVKPKPPVSVRAKVQERMARIIASEVASVRPQVGVTETGVTISFDTLQVAEEKWLIPRKARGAFRSATFEVLLLVGEQNLVQKGAEVLLELPSTDFHRLFSPLLAAMGSMEVLEAWLASTNLIEFQDHDGKTCDTGSDTE